MFKPRFPQINWSLYLALLVMGALMCYTLDVPAWSYAATLGLGTLTVGWVVHQGRALQLRQYGELKARGIRAVWEGSPDIQGKMEANDFVAFFEARMGNAQWRSCVLATIGQARWVGVTDHFTHPYTFRWELRGATPVHWDDDDRFCLYVACMACLPSWYPYQLEIDKKHFLLKNGAAYTAQIPRVYTDAPAITLQFWNFFQKNMAMLMDNRVEFNTPSFQMGLAQDVDIAVPSRFELAAGGTLTVDKEGSTYCVSVFSSTGQPGPIQRYGSANEFWWVWRNAIEHKPLA